jgi:hypothetical protein
MACVYRVEQTLKIFYMPKIMISEAKIAIFSEKNNLVGKIPLIQSSKYNTITKAL